MKPKKKTIFPLIIYFFFFLVVIYFSLHIATAYDYTENKINTGKIEEKEKITVFIEKLTKEINGAPFDFKITKRTQKSLLWGSFFWLVIILYIENSKKNFIHGKEFGTAKWGGISDIKDLFAENIALDEIKKTKKSKTNFGRWIVKRKILKDCKKNAELLRKDKIKKLNNQRQILIKNGEYNKEIYNKELKKIKKETDEIIEVSIREAWKPYQLEYDYTNNIEEIEKNNLYNSQEKKERKRKEKEKFKNALEYFFDTTRKINDIKEKYKDADMLFTKSEKISLYNWKLNNNTLILGGSGSGKTRGFVMPNVLQAHSSYIITDPKGEILEKSGYFLSKIKGYKIRVLNLDEKTMSDGYNPFCYIHPEREGYEERILSLIETIIINTDGGEKRGSSDPFWEKAEKLFLQAIFFFTCDGFIEDERNMNTVLELISMLQIQEEEDNYDSDLDYFAIIFEEQFGKDHIGVQQWKEFRQKASGKTAKSIVISAVARLAPFKTNAVKTIFSYDSMNLDMVGEEKTAIFVVVPPTDNTFNFIAGMLFTQLFQELQYCATQKHKHDGQRLPVPCRFILDEFANTCKIPNFVKILAYARSFGIGITPILQSLEQIKNMYKDEWGVIVDNCNELLYLGSITHKDTLEYMSFLLGKGTFDKRTTGHTRGKQGSSSENFDVIGRELMTPDEIRRMDKNNCILIIGGRKPFFSEKFDYQSHKNFIYTSDGNNSYSYHYEPTLPTLFPHGEETKTNSNIFESDEKIELIENKEILLNEITNKFEEMNIEDLNELNLTEEDQEKFLNYLIEEDNRNENNAKKILEVSIATQNYVKDIEQELPKLEENSSTILNVILKEEFMPDMSEEEDYIFDKTDEEFFEMDTIDDISKLINEDKMFKELLEEEL